MPASPGLREELQKAKIKNLETNEVLELKFNPTEYSFSKSNTWTKAETRGADVPALEFGGGEPIQLTMEVFFDTHEEGTDVRTYTNKLWKLVLVDPGNRDSTTQQGSPPQCEFQWGMMWSFKAVITSLSMKFTMFMPNGTPTRATANITLKQAEDPGQKPFQNPTSGGNYGYKTHQVTQHEPLDLIASREYGDTSAWKFIAEFNDIDNPFSLTPGTVLALPPSTYE